MAVTVERTFEIDKPIDVVWELLSDEGTRATAIEVVEDYYSAGEETIWEVTIPIPLVDRTVSVRTWEVEQDPPNYVRFVGRSKVVDVRGEHRLFETETGCRVESRFVADGKLPGVEKFFKERFDIEIQNIEAHVRKLGASMDEV